MIRCVGFLNGTEVDSLFCFALERKGRRVPALSRHGPPDHPLCSVEGEGNRVSDRHRSEHGRYPTDWFLATSSLQSKSHNGYYRPDPLGPRSQTVASSVLCHVIYLHGVCPFCPSKPSLFRYLDLLTPQRQGKARCACLCAIVSCQAADAAMLQWWPSCCHPNLPPRPAVSNAAQQSEAAGPNGGGGCFPPLEQPANLLDDRQEPPRHITSTMAAGRL